MQPQGDINRFNSKYSIIKQGYTSLLFFTEQTDDVLSKNLCAGLGWNFSQALITAKPVLD